MGGIDAGRHHQIIQPRKRHERRAGGHAIAWRDRNGHHDGVERGPDLRGWAVSALAHQRVQRGAGVGDGFVRLGKLVARGEMLGQEFRRVGALGLRQAEAGDGLAVGACDAGGLVEDQQPGADGNPLALGDQKRGHTAILRQADDGAAALRRGRLAKRGQDIWHGALLRRRRGDEDGGWRLSQGCSARAYRQHRPQQRKESRGAPHSHVPALPGGWTINGGRPAPVSVAKATVCSCKVCSSVAKSCSFAK